MSDKVNQGIFLPISAIITGIIAPPLGMLLGILGVCKAPGTSLRAKLSICAIGISSLVWLGLFYHTQENVATVAAAGASLIGIIYGVLGVCKTRIASKQETINVCIIIAFALIGLVIYYA